MTNLEKIKKWANENGYECRYDVECPYCCITKYFETDNFMKGVQEIRYYFENGISSSIVLSNHLIHDEQQLESLFIPLNNVKRDEKLLKEYLKDEN